MGGKIGTVRNLRERPAGYPARAFGIYAASFGGRSNGAEIGCEGFDSLRAYVAEIRLPAYETETVEVEDEDAKDSTEEATEDTTPADEQDAAEEAGVTGDEQQEQAAEPATMAAKQTKTVTHRLPLDMSKVELDLFAIDGIYINQLDGEF